MNSDQFSEKPMPPEQKECPRCSELMPIDAERCWLCLERFPETLGVKVAQGRRQEGGRMSLDDVIGEFVDKVGWGVLVFVASLITLVLAYEVPELVVTASAILLFPPVAMLVFFFTKLILDAKKRHNPQSSQPTQTELPVLWQRNAAFAFFGLLIVAFAMWTAFVTACSPRAH